MKCKVTDHEIGYKAIGGFPGHEHIHPSGPQVCFKCGKTVAEIVADELETILKHGHGGGNWRRLLIIKIGECRNELTRV